MVVIIDYIKNKKFTEKIFWILNIPKLGKVRSRFW